MVTVGVNIRVGNMVFVTTDGRLNVCETDCGVVYDADNIIAVFRVKMK